MVHSQHPRNINKTFIYVLKSPPPTLENETRGALTIVHQLRCSDETLLFRSDLHYCVRGVIFFIHKTCCDNI